MANIRIRHNKFFKALTIFGASIGVAAGGAFTTFLTMDVNGVNPFITDELRSYTARFYSEGALLEEVTLKRGELLGMRMPPPHSMDGDVYVPLGWDTTGNGIIDIIPPRMYYSFDANAVYMRIGQEDIAKLLEKLLSDPEALLELLEKLNIDWQSLMELLNIDPSMLSSLLKNMAILEFTPSDQDLAYFRTTSLGDFNYKNKKFAQADYYDSNKISQDSINPLSYTADKLHTALNMVGTNGIASTFKFTNYNIRYNSTKSYPVPDCQYPSDSENRIDSDAHYRVDVTGENTYQAEGAYIPAKKEVFDILRMIPYSNAAIANDERAYYQYAKEKYTTIPKEYETVIDQIIEENDWYPEDYNQIDEIGGYVENLGSWSNPLSDMFPVPTGQSAEKPKKNDDPVLGLIENGVGSDLDFNATAVMICRRLNIPARMVHGYIYSKMFSMVSGPDGEPMFPPGIITGLNEHYWCEIYVNRIGWMIFDCINTKDVLGFNIYGGELNKDKNALTDEAILDHIEVTPPEKLTYEQGERIDKSTIGVEAFFDTGESKTLKPSDFTLEYSTEELGEQTVTVSYNYNGVTKTDTFTITVIEKKDPKGEGTERFDTSKTQKDFNTGDEFTYNDITCTVTYEDKSTEQVPADQISVDYSEVDMSQPGTYTVNLTATLGDKEYHGSYEITVTEKPVVIEDVTIVSEPTKVQYHQQEEFDPTGLEVELEMSNGEKVKLNSDEYEITGIEEGDMNEIGTKTVTVTYTRESDGKEFQAQFDIEVIENPIEEIEIDPQSVKQDYQVGDYFDVDEFLENAKATGSLEYADASKDIDLEGADVTYELTGAPDLSKEGETNATVTVTVTNADGTKTSYDVDIPMEVGGVNPDKFTLSSDVATSGPGNFEGTDLFKYKTDHVGTIYFRYGSYSTYKNATWSEPVATSDQFTYDKATQVYANEKVDIEYLQNTDFSIIPAYSNAKSSGKKKIGDKEEGVDFTTFELTDESYKRLIKYVNFSTEVNSQYNSYRTNVVSATGPYKQVTASDDAKVLINTFISSNNINSQSDNLAKVLLIRSILKSYTYNANFSSYDCSIDPVGSFLEHKEGICSDFASAAVMIFRQAGIPARYCTGFAVQSDGTEGVCNSIRAHGWSEVWLDNIGWVIVDCTGYDNSSSEKDMTPGAGDFYGNPPAGDGEEDLYSFGKQDYGADIEITYKFNNVEIEEDKDDFEIDYNGMDYKSLITIDYTMPDVPSFLDLKLTLVPVGLDEPEEATNANGHNGRDVGTYSYEVKLTLKDYQTGEDVTDQYSYTIANPRTITYTVMPRLLLLNVGVKDTYKDKMRMDTNYNKSYFNLTVDEEFGLVDKDSVDFSITGTYVKFPNVGTYYDYGDNFVFTIIRDNKSTDVVTNNYIIIPDFESVEVKP